MALSKAKILAAKDSKIEKISVPEWGGDLCLKVLTGTDRDMFEEQYSSEKMKNFRSRFLVLCMCDEKGERMFTEEEVDDLGKKSAKVIAKVFDAAWELNAFRNEDIERLGNGSTEGQSDSSTSS
jgi:hypothetical protein